MSHCRISRFREYNYVLSLRNWGEFKGHREHKRVWGSKNRDLCSATSKCFSIEMSHYLFICILFTKYKIAKCKRYSVFHTCANDFGGNFRRVITKKKKKKKKKKTCAGIELSNGRRCVEMQQQENATRDAQSATAFQHRPVPFVACSRRGREEWVSHTPTRLESRHCDDDDDTHVPLSSHETRLATNVRPGKRSTFVPETDRPFPFLSHVRATKSLLSPIRSEKHPISARYRQKISRSET